MSGPNRFVVQKYANVGTKEPFTAAFLGLTDLVDAASFDPAKKVEIKNIIMEIYMDCMLPAFLSLRKIQQPDAGAGMADNFKNYDDLYRYLVRALKDRTQAAAKAIGYEIGFLFQKDKPFEDGCKEFGQKYPELPTFGDCLKNVRLSTEKLAAIRNNFLEHQSHPRTEFMDYYKPDVAQVFFDSAWQEAEAILAVFISKHFPPFVKLRIIPEQERDPNLPKKFGFSYAPQGTDKTPD
jgi:hypothetical protein